MKKKVIYIGNIANVAEYISMNDNIELLAVISEKKSISDEILNFVYLRKVKLYDVENKSDLENILNRFEENNILLISGFGLILNEKILNRFKVFNIHFGVLPNYKGRHPSFFATLNNEKEIGVTLHLVDLGIDSGNIIEVIKEPYYFYENENDIFNKLLLRIPELLNSFIYFLDNKISSKSNYGGNYYKPVNQSDITITENTDISKILNIVRAQSKYQGALFRYQNNIFGITKVRITQSISLCENFNCEKLMIKNNIPYGIWINENHCLIFENITKLN